MYEKGAAQTPFRGPRCAPLTEDLARRIREGEDDPAIWRAIMQHVRYRLQWTPAGSFCREDQEDIVVEVTERVFRGIHTFRGESFPAWVQGITRNVALEMLKQRHGENVSLNALNAARQPADPQDMQREIEFAERIQQFCALLSSEQQEVFRLRFLEESSYEEIGRRCGKTPNAVGQMLNEIRQKLKKHREEQERQP